MLRSSLRLSRLPILATSTCVTLSTSTSCSAASSSEGEREKKNHFDLLVIGGGSGGLACAKRAAGHGASVGLFEGGRLGGTCVNVGCVPKKVMFNAAHVMETVHEAKNFGISTENVSFDWAALKSYRDRYIQRLNSIYAGGLNNAKVTRIEGRASFNDNKSVKVGNNVYSADNILIATGGAPAKLGVPGEEHVLDSDGFFELETQPKKVAVLGAGYIAVELAGVFNGLGTDTSLFVRKQCALRNFDEMISSHLDECMKKSGDKCIIVCIVPKITMDVGIKVNPGSTAKKIVKENDGTLSLYLQNGEVHKGFDCIVSAIGRKPATSELNLEKAGVESTRSGHIKVDEYQNTSVEGIKALGDVCGKVELTPMAIAAGRRLADRLYGGMPDAKADYDMVPTVVFSHPVIGTIGMTEKEAREKYSDDDLKVYKSTFVNLYYGNFLKGEGGKKPVTKYKLICQGPEQRVIGLHAIGMASDEILQGFGVAMKMGATKADFDRCIAIHPTAAEEMVTLAPWGFSDKKQ